MSPKTSQVRGSIGGPPFGSSDSGLNSPNSKTSAPIAAICVRTASVVISNDEGKRVTFERIIPHRRARGARIDTEDSTESFGTFCVE